MYFINLFKFLKLLFQYLWVEGIVTVADSFLILTAFKLYEKFKFKIKRFKREYIPFFFAWYSWLFFLILSGFALVVSSYFIYFLTDFYFFNNSTLLVLENGRNFFYFDVSFTNKDMWYQSYLFYEWLNYGIIEFDSLNSSLLYIIITIFPFCYYYIMRFSNRHSWAFYLLLTQTLLIISFLTWNVITFFICFELLMLPMYKLILSWGGDGEAKKTASDSFILYTIAGSFLLLIVFISISATCTASYALLDIRYINFSTIYIPDGLFIPFFIALCTKMPSFPFYHWLTLAHVEASTVGSIILASMILKLGGFAIIRFVLPLFKNSYTYQKNLSSIFTVITISMIFISLTALYQTDLKRIIAHSSIEHMNLSLLGLVMGTPVSLTGGFILMLAHGWISAGLFFSIGLVYDHYKQRDLLYYRGYAHYNSWWSISFSLLLLANIGFPFTLNFLAEFQILLSFFSNYFFYSPILLLIMMCNISYSFKMATIMWGPSTSFWDLYDKLSSEYLRAMFTRFFNIMAERFDAWAYIIHTSRWLCKYSPFCYHFFNIIFEYVIIPICWTVRSSFLRSKRKFETFFLQISFLVFIVVLGGIDIYSLWIVGIDTQLLILS